MTLPQADHAVIVAARDLAPRIRELAPQIDHDRRLPQALVDDLARPGLFSMLLPKDYGGLELDPLTAALAVEEVARADGSTGWCLMIANQNAALSGFLPPAEAKAMFANGGIAAGTARPIGRAIATNDPAPGYIVSGRWPFASGSTHATWFAAECIVYDGEQARKDANGDDVSRFTFVPREQVTVHDNWDTLGLRGTASNDFSIEGAFVPAARGFQILVDPPRSPSALFKAFPLVVINHGSHSLGVARGAIDSAIEIAKTKRGWGGVAMHETPRMQSAIAVATAEVESASDYFYDTARKLWEAALAGKDDPVLRAKTRLAASHATAASVRAVDILHAACATTAIFTKSPLERQFRDIHTAAAHVMIGQLTFEAAGRVLLGLDPAFPFF